MILSKFGEKFTTKTGILQLMDDLGTNIDPLDQINMLGGGNPAVIEEVSQYFNQNIQKLSDKLTDSVGRYSSPQGDSLFIKTLADFLNRHYDLGVSEKNIALTNGSQNAFFYLFNLFAGEFPDGSEKKILLPLVPEYLGYSDVQVNSSYFKSYEPKIEKTNFKGKDGFFKYKADFSKIKIDSSIGAICCSRPTNPTGNVLTNDEVSGLSQLAKDNHIPLIIDNAYGDPFPGILFSKSQLFWDEHIILSLSLSKIGLPGVRTGIVVASEAIIEMISSLNAVINLAPSNFGPAVMTPLLENDQVLHLSKDIIQPYYLQKVNFAIELLQKQLDGYPMHIHQPEGSIFLWLWFEGLPISTTTLYQQLKARKTFIVPGEYFFPGLEKTDRHKHKTECIRMSYAQSEIQLKRGIADIAELVKQAYDSKNDSY